MHRPGRRTPWNQTRTTNEWRDSNPPHAAPELTPHPDPDPVYTPPQLELPSNRRRQQPPAAGPAANGPAPAAAQQQQRPAHKKQLRAKDASYSESIIQDFRREEIPTELAKLYDLQDIVGIGTTSKVYKCKRRARADVFACKVRGDMCGGWCFVYFGVGLVVEGLTW